MNTTFHQVEDYVRIEKWSSMHYRDGIFYIHKNVYDNMCFNRQGRYSMSCYRHMLNAALALIRTEEFMRVDGELQPLFKVVKNRWERGRQNPDERVFDSKRNPYLKLALANYEVETVDYIKKVLG